MRDPPEFPFWINGDRLAEHLQASGRNGGSNTTRDEAVRAILNIVHRQLLEVHLVALQCVAWRGLL